MTTAAGPPDLDALARRWAADLRAWEIPPEILAAAPESPWGFPTGLWVGAAEAALADPEPTPSGRRALEALSRAGDADGGTVLDVGCGAGAASLALVPPAAETTGVDESQGMLDAFAVGAAARAVPHAAVRGRWPDVAARVPPADVVVCHHVLYNVPDIVPFVEELHRHARRRVVVEITETHPLTELNALWRLIHGTERPTAPSATDVERLLDAMGIHPEVERFQRPSPWTTADRGAHIAFARKRLCVGPERDADIAAHLTPRDRGLVTLWWDVR